MSETKVKNYEPSARDWPGDFDYENGQYQNKCVSCDSLFIGHKGRRTCKKCFDTANEIEALTARVRALQNTRDKDVLLSMTTSERDTIIRSLHQAYVSETGYDIKWDASRVFAWELFSLRFTKEDLILVIRWIKKQKRLGNPARELMFRSLISGWNALSSFEEDLQRAKADARIPRYAPGKADVLRATTRPDAPTPSTERKAGDVLKASDALAKFREWREQSGI